MIAQSIKIPFKRIQIIANFLRFLAFSFELTNYKGSLNEFLNSFMRENRNFEKISRNKLELQFYSTMDFILESIGEYAFFKNKQFNKILFETLSLFVSISADNISLTHNKMKSFSDALKIDEGFWKLSKSATTSRNNIYSRIEYAISLYKTI